MRNITKIDFNQPNAYQVINDRKKLILKVLDNIEDYSELTTEQQLLLALEYIELHRKQQTLYSNNSRIKNGKKGSPKIANKINIDELF